MATNYEKVRAYYAAFDEWSRLESPEGALEFVRAMRILDEYLTPQSRILDLGGGPGRYTIELAKRGHRVVLADVSPALLAQARERIASLAVGDGVESIDEVSAEDLRRYSDESFDAVIAFGPFYHLVSQVERSRAASELSRVLKRGGLAFVAFIPRVSGIVGLIDRAARRPEQVSAETLRAVATNGAFSNCSASGFQEGYYPTVDELESLLRAAGIHVLAAVSLRSVGDRLERQMMLLAPSVRSEAERVLEQVSTWPEVVATSGHALLIARRPKAG